MESRNKICLFCCKQISSLNFQEETGLPEWTKNSHCLTLLGRYFGVQKYMSKILLLQSDNVEFPNGSCRNAIICSLCLSVLKSFSYNYNQMKYFELQVQWKADTLINVMREASRVPSRVKLVKQVFGDEERNFTCFWDTRKEIIRKGSRHLVASFPCVQLENLKVGIEISQDSQNSPNATTKVKLDMITDTNDQSNESLKIWMLSYFAVVMLLLTDTQNSYNSNGGRGNDFISDLFLDDENCLNDGEMVNNKLYEKLRYVKFSSENLINSEENLYNFPDHSMNDETEDLDYSTSSSSCSNDSNQASSRLMAKQEPEPLSNSTLVDPESGNNLPVNLSPSKNHNELGNDGQEAKPIIPQPKNKICKNQFPCDHCSNTYRFRSSLLKHLRANHPEQAIKLIRPVRSAQFNCKVCKKEYKSYQLYFGHIKSSEHRRKLNRKQIAGRSNKTNRSHNNKRSKMGKTNVSTKCKYNLRRKTSKKRINTTTGEDQEKDSISSDESDDNISDDNLSSSSSSSSINSESDEEAKLVGKTKYRNHRPPNCKFEYCRLDGCNYQTHLPMKYQEHKKLHEPGEYPCNFCKVVKANAIKLALHEFEHHAKLHKKKSSDVTYCSRCTYQSVYLLNCVNHFSQVHLGFPKRGPQQCAICHLKFASIKMHMKCHDISKVDPSKVIYCSEADCSAYFTTSISKFAYRQHRVKYHKINDIIWSSDEDGDNNDNDEDEESFACKFCKKRFISASRLGNHVRSFHSKNNGNDTLAKSNAGKFICPEIKCSKSFKSVEVLEKHGTLHGKFKCQFCDVIKEYAPDLAYHEVQHGVTRDEEKCQAKCPRCNGPPVSKPIFITHFLESHLGLTNRFLDCSVCHEKFVDEFERKYHFKTYHGLGTVDLSKTKKCDNCPAYFLKEKQLKFHQKHCSKNGEIGGKSVLVRAPREKYYCSADNCMEWFRLVEELEGHEKLHGQFECSVCEFKSDYCVTLANHELEHMSAVDNATKKSFNCSRCEHIAYYLPQYHLHFIEKHFGINPKIFICTICQATFLSDYVRVKHNKYCHNTEGMDPGSIAKCNKCSAPFRTKYQLAQHNIKIHENNSNFKCDLCNKSYKSRRFLRHHRRNVHKDSNIFQDKLPCDIPNCKYVFETEDDLALHKVYTHPSGKLRKREIPAGLISENVKCDICEKECKGTRALKIHMKVHNESRPKEFKCDQCEKIFKAKADLQAHLEYHKRPEEWKFMCAMCSKKFATKQNLVQHMNTHTKAKPFVCQICGEKYAHRHNLRNHVNSKHKDEGVQDIAKKFNRKYFVSRKGKKLGPQFCFTNDQDTNQ